MPKSPFYPAFHWQHADHLPVTLDDSARDWLLEEGSLTQRLTRLANGVFHVEPLAECWQVLRDDECQALGVRLGSPGWVREVYLHGHRQPWIFARSVAARSQLAASRFDLTTLGDTSLGHRLFRDNAFQRGAFEVCRYPSALLPEAVRESDLYCRRSRFSREALDILVAEVFLPKLWQHAGIPNV